MAKFWHRIKSLLKYEPVRDFDPPIKGHMREPNAQSEIYGHNSEALALASYMMERDALNKTLRYAYATMILAIIAVLVSIGIGLFAIFYRPKVEVQPVPVQIVQPKQ